MSRFNPNDYRPAPDLDAYDWEHSADDHEDDRSTAAHALAVVFLAAQDALCEEPGDPFSDALAAIQFLLPEADFRILALAIERCPMHLCDAAICADDAETSCIEVRA